MSTLHNLPLGDFYQGCILNFAHRGAREHAPENTLPALERAADLGADGIELDVQLSRDGIPVVIHDFRVDRTTDDHGLVADMALAELHNLDAGAYFSAEFIRIHIPTLDEVFEAIGNRLLVNIELKERSASSRLAQAVTKCVAAHNMTQRVIISSSNPITLRHVRQAAPEIAIGYLSYPDMRFPLSEGWLVRPIIGQHEAQHPSFSLVDEKYIRWAHKRGYRVNTWTVNQIEDIQRMRDLGVDMIISDRPYLVQDVLQGER